MVSQKRALCEEGQFKGTCMAHDLDRSREMDLPHFSAQFHGGNVLLLYEGHYSMNAASARVQHEKNYEYKVRLVDSPIRPVSNGT
jgi:hypothetical protein